MTKAELISAVAEKSGLTKKDSDKATVQGLKALKEAQKQTTASNKRLNDLHDKIDNAKTCDESVSVAKELL